MASLRGGAPAPASPFPILPLRTGVLFPAATLALTVGRPRSLAMLHALHVGDVIGVVPQRDGKVLEPSEDDLARVGTYARIVQVARQSDRAYRVVLEGVGRLELQRLVTADPFWTAEGAPIDETGAGSDEAVLLAGELRRLAADLARDFAVVVPLPEELSPGEVGDAIAAALGLESALALEVLAERDVPERLRRVVGVVGALRQRAEVKAKVESDVRRELGKHQREAVLREQLRAIQKELGDGEGGEAEKLRQRLAAAELPEEVREQAERELGRLEASGGQGPEANVLRTYLDWVASLPWSKRAVSDSSLDDIAARLDADHAGLEDVKKRILEHMAVLQLSGNPRGTLLCFVGPPGVGKTSLGQSIADATGRPFVRIALGGVRDEAEIRGHRRTYVGALPGRLLHALRKAGVKNPVILLDEIDKVGSSWAGSPEAALLEVLDPEQNRTFTDHYLEAPFDLSEVLFLCTANQLEPLSAPLRDRLEVVELSGYTVPEKLAIARGHLLPKRLRESGVPVESLIVTDTALSAIVAEYTREAGVRQLDRELLRVTRGVALEIARAREAEATIVVDAPDLDRYLGKPRFHSEVAERTSAAGVATGLAWTPAGGDILFIETTRMPGKGSIEITGQLGDVMKESARAALSFVKSHAEALGVPRERLADADLHIHVPAGAVPKDGPSAGVTMFTALTSLLSGRRVRSDTAMTGEVTLRGRVLPVGGIKSKVLAAHRAGIRRVILPARNERDLADVPREVRDELEVIFASDVVEVLAAALEPAPPALGEGDVPSPAPTTWATA
ncbi:MAG: endopeptidase La [Polyangiaceae bacterium]|nr:endopeptidase La [Polyangiaceae bacterium]